MQFLRSNTKNASGRNGKTQKTEYKMKRIIDALVDYMPLVLLVFFLTVGVISIAVSDIIEKRTAMSQGYIQKVEGSKTIWVKPINQTVGK